MLRTTAARAWDRAAAAGPGRPAAIAHLMQRRNGYSHWAHEYAARLMEQVPPDRPTLIQSSMSPTGPFHIGNFRDTVTAFLIHRAVQSGGRASRILLSFDDFDPVRRRPAELGAGTASAPLADAGPAVRELCRTYLRELRAVGICPRDRDPDARAPSPEWATHFQAERYRSGEYLTEQRRFVQERVDIASCLGVDRSETLFAPYCQQCGRNTTSVHPGGGRTVGYACRTCGAEVRTRQLQEVKPVWALDWSLRVLHEGIDCEPAGHDHCSAGSTMDRTQPLYARYLNRPQPVIVPYGLVRQDSHLGRVSGSLGGGLCVRDLLEVLSPTLVLWAYAVPDVRSDLRISLARPAVLRLYPEFDRFTRAAAAPGRERDLWKLLSDDDPPPPIVGFRRAVGVLAAHLYDLRATTRSLAAEAPPDGADPGGIHADADADTKARLAAALRAAARWDRPGWLPDVASDPDPGHVAAVLERLMTHGPDCRLDRSQYRTIYAMLFGGSDGPSLRGLVHRLGPAVVLDALQAFANSGRRPLRELTVGRLVDAAPSEVMST